MAGLIGRRSFLRGVGAAGAYAGVSGVVPALSARSCEKPPPPPPPPEPALLGVHPGAAAQPTAWGRRLQELAVFDGRVFAGYGDWGANTGPLAVDAWDIAMGDWVHEATLVTESTWVLRVLGDRLVAPFIDPAGNHGDLAVRAAGSATWTTHVLGEGTAGSLHCFDAATLDGTDLWVVGARRPGRDAAVWRSPSGLGGDWVVADVVASVDSHWMRLVTLVEHEGRLLTSGYSVDETNTATAFSGRAGDLDGWADAPDYTFDVGAGVHRVGHDPAVFDGGVVRTRSWPSPAANTPYELVWFDGATITVGPELAYALAVDERGWLWYLDQTGALCVRTSRAGASAVMAAGPPGASCLAVAGDRVYVGTEASELWVLDFS
jgi:hypothetical protein